MTVHAQIVDDVVVGVFSGPQDPEYWPDVEEIEEDDPRLVEFIAATNIKGTL
jgi:hypothetical protein